MGTQKQATALVAIVNNIRHQRGKYDLPPEAVAEYTAKVLAMSLPEVQAEFKTYNGIGGFDRYESPATVNQRRTIGYLERGVYGEQRTTYRDRLSYMEASDIITALASARDAMRGAVRDAEEFANASADIPSLLTL